MKPISTFLLGLLITTTAHGQVTNPPATQSNRWVAYLTDEGACGLERATPQFRIRLAILKKQASVTATLYSPGWNLKTGQYEVEMIAGDLKDSSTVLVIAGTTIFFEIPVDQKFRTAIALSQQLTIKNVPGSLGIGDLNLPFDHGEEALKLLAECGIPSSATPLGPGVLQQ